MARAVVIFAVVYVLGYVLFRSLNVETWSEDGRDYVIFPEDRLWVYYLLRPMSYLDGLVTGIRSHIGDHL